MNDKLNPSNISKHVVENTTNYKINSHVNQVQENNCLGTLVLESSLLRFSDWKKIDKTLSLKAKMSTVFISFKLNILLSWLMSKTFLSGIYTYN